MAPMRLKAEAPMMAVATVEVETAVGEEMVAVAIDRPRRSDSFAKLSHGIRSRPVDNARR